MVVIVLGIVYYWYYESNIILTDTVKRQKSTVYNLIHFINFIMALSRAENKRLTIYKVRKSHHCLQSSLCSSCNLCKLLGIPTQKLIATFLPRSLQEFE